MSFAFVRATNFREAREVISSTESATNFDHSPNTELLGATNSQAAAEVLLTDVGSLSAGCGSVTQMPVPYHIPADTMNTIARQNVRNPLNLSNPKTPKKKKTNKKPKTPNSARKESVGNGDLRPTVMKPVSQTPHTPGNRSELKELHTNTVVADECVTKAEQILPSSQSIPQASSKQTDNGQEVNNTKNTLETLPAPVEDLKISVTHKHNIGRRNDTRADREHLNILDGSPSRKPRNVSSSRQTSQPQSHVSPTEACEQVIPSKFVGPDLSEDQWPALQLPSHIPEREHGPSNSKRVTYRSLSINAALEAKEGSGPKNLPTRNEINDAGEGPSNTMSKVTIPVSNRAKSLDWISEPQELPTAISIVPSSKEVKNHSVAPSKDLCIKVPSSPTSVEPSQEVSSAGGYTTTDPPSYSQTERSNSWVEELGKDDISLPSKSYNTEDIATEQTSNIISDTSETPHTSSALKIHNIEDGLLLAHLSKQEDDPLSSDINMKFEGAPSSDQTALGIASTQNPTVHIEPPLSKSQEGTEEKTKDSSALTSSVASSVVNSDTNIMFSSRAKGKHKILTIEVSKRPHMVPAPQTSSPLSNSPKSSKPKQRVEEPMRSSSSLPVPSPAISTHMKKKTKKITPTRKPARTGALMKKDTEVDKPPTNSSERVTLDGSSKDEALSNPTFEQERVLPTHSSTESNFGASEAAPIDLIKGQGQGEEVLDDVRKEKHATMDETQPGEQVSQTRNYPAPDPFNAVYVSEFRGPPDPKRERLALTEARPESQLVKSPTYPAANPSSAVYVAGRFPTRTLVLECSDQAEDQKVVATPPSSSEMPSKKERIRTKKGKKRKSKETSEHGNISASILIAPFPKPNVQPAAFPTLPLEEPSSTDLQSHDPEVNVEIHDPFTVLNPVLQSGHDERRDTELWINTVTQKRKDTETMMTLKSLDKSSEVEALDKLGPGYRKKKMPYKSELLQHIDNMEANGLGLTMEHDLEGRLMSTRPSMNDVGAVLDLTSGPSTVSSSSNIIFSDVSGYTPQSMSTLLAPVNLTHEPSFNSDILETSVLKARPPPHQPEFNSNIFDRPAFGVESSTKSPLAAEFGSGLVSVDLTRHIEESKPSSKGLSPIPSPVEQISRLDNQDIPSTVPEKPLKKTKTKISEGADPSTAASGFEYVSPEKPEASSKRLEKVDPHVTVSDIQSLLSVEHNEIVSQSLDDMKSIILVKPLCKVEPLESRAPKEEELEDEVSSQRPDLSDAIIDRKSVLSIESQLIMQPSEVVNQSSMVANIEGFPPAEQISPTKTAGDVEPISAVSEASTVKPFPVSNMPASPPRLSEANVTAHTVATDSNGAGEISRSRTESISEWSTTSSFRRKTYSEAANHPSSTPRTRGQSIVGVTSDKRMCFANLVT